MKDSRGKGARFMREVSVTLSRWIDPKLPAKVRMQDCAIRPRSTSILPVEGHWDGEGDLLHRPDVHWPFAVECKLIEGWDLDGLLTNAKSPINSWWSQTISQARKKYPMLVFSRNRREPLVMFPARVLRWMEVSAHQELGPLHFIVCTRGLADRVIVPLRDLVLLPAAAALNNPELRKCQR